MGETVYADILFLINFSMDFLCFYICSRILGREIKKIRVSMASAVGGAYSVALLFFSPPPLADALLDISVLLIITAVSGMMSGMSLGARFGFAALYAGASAALGGIMTAVYSLANSYSVIEAGDGGTEDGISVWIFALLAAAGAAATLFGGRKIKRRAESDRLKINVSVYIQGNSRTFVGMTDSGNLVCDPISGRRVIICELSVVDGILPPEVSCLIRSGGIVSGLRRDRISSDTASKIRLIPASGALGDGILCAVLPDRVVLSELSGKKHKTVDADVLLAPVPRRLSADGSRALVPCGLI